MFDFLFDYGTIEVRFRTIEIIVAILVLFIASTGLVYLVRQWLQNQRWLEHELKRVQEELKRRDEQLDPDYQKKVLERVQGQIAHDIVRDLNKIISLSSMTYKGLDKNNDENSGLRLNQSRIIEVASLQKAYAENLTHQLSFESSQLSSNYSSESLPSIVSVIKLEYHDWASTRGLKFNEQLPSFPAVINSNSPAVTQIIKNIFTNAIKFNKEGGEIRIRYRAIENDPDLDNGVCLEITDEGIGISDEDQKRLREGRAPIGIRNKLPGTRKGLLNSMELAQQLGGYVKLVCSGLDRGSTFEVYFPFNPMVSEKNIAN